MEGFEDCGLYWLSNSIQGTTKWKNERKNRLTASNFGAAIGQSKFETPDSVREKMNGKIVPTNAAMEHGIKYEPIVRKNYEKIMRVKVREVGLAVPKWDTRIGASADGLVGNDGMIEIKCPQKIKIFLLITNCNAWKYFYFLSLI